MPMWRRISSDSVRRDGHRRRRRRSRRSRPVYVSRLPVVGGSLSQFKANCCTGDAPTTATPMVGKLSAC